MSTSQSQRSAVRALILDEPKVGDATSETAEWLQRLCRAAVRALPASGAGVSVMTDQGSQGVIAAADPTSHVIDELQFTLGEGPCLDAYATRRPVLASNLDTEPAARWPAYASAVHAHGVRAVFAFPLQIGPIRLGVLDVYRTHPGSLSEQAVAQAQSFAEVALLSLLERQQHAAHGQTGVELGQELNYRTEVYQAQGMVLAQLGVDLDEAMMRLRAHAYATDKRLGDVARDILSGTLRLERDT